MNIIFLVFELCVRQDNILQLLNLDFHAPEELEAPHTLPLLGVDELDGVGDYLLLGPRVLLYHQPLI